MAVGTYALVTLADCNQYLGFTTADDSTRDGLIEKLIDRSTSIIENYCGRKFKSRKYRLERYDGDGDEFLFVKQRPIRSIDTVSIGERTALTVTCEDSVAVHASIDINSDGVTVTQIKGTGNGVSSLTFANYATVSAIGAVIAGYTSWSSTTATDMGQHVSSDLLDMYGKYCLDTDLDVTLPEAPINNFTVYKEGGLQLGILQRESKWSGGTMNVSMTYTAGYVSVPNDVQQACVSLVADFYNRSTKDMNLKQEKLGDYSYTLADNLQLNSKVNIISSSGVASLLNAYKNVWVVG